MVHKRSNIKLWPFFLFIAISCTSFKAYFNTFYNAEELFQKAEEIRQKTENDKLPKTALDHYEKVIQKSRFILEEYPDVRFRKDALLLIIQSHFYRQEYIDVKLVLSELSSEFGDVSLVDINYWSSMVKWKEGKTQPAINSLIALLDYDIDITTQSKIYLTIAEIYFEQKINDKSMDYLELAAKPIRERSEKGQIYFRIAELSFDQKDYARSINAYEQTIKNSQIKKRVQLSHLKIVQIFRLQNKFDLAISTIKNMLIDENYQSIYASLELELAKLYQIQGKTELSNTRLENIIKDYPRTQESAESSYLLGENALIIDRDYENSLKYFSMVRSEFKSSLFIKSAQVKIKEINAYLKLIKEYDIWTNTIISNDTLQINISDDKIVKMLYGIAELEALHFSNYDSALIYLDKLLDMDTGSRLLPKALYMKSVIFDNSKQQNLSKKIKQRIINDFPQSDYAYAIIQSNPSFSTNLETSNDFLIKAEEKWNNDQILALDIYKSIVNNDTISESGLNAAYFLAYNYDYKFIRPDSAKKFYEWIIKYHSASDQAKPSIKRLTAITKVLNTNERN